MAGRGLRETYISFGSGLKIGRFNAVEYFQDGSFYLLDSPGHAIGHMCALARVTTNPNSYIFMGGDSCHHKGEFRPSPYHPLPKTIIPNPLQTPGASCPGSLFEPLLRDDDREKPFYTIARLEDGKGVAHDVNEAEETKVMEADGSDGVLVVMAHDDTLKDVVSFFPSYANAFKENGWAEKGRWLFLRDSVGAVKYSTS
ncbi:putative N-acyl homoserine lactonase AttM [Sclerotinia borealis F-4128]|uniref:Putative N-acyl homoserine lactonase AttM n=1 Tax=Sclerotinia borealis (strain F-4128) TaxID=1432307 RepID=W9CWJ9_SCLBF|nr:putative N-acyl homoserine lactonase AttM [Sclerotinia borealis F-4128]